MQPFKTYDEQIAKLKNDKNLIINDEDYAKSILKQIGYYSLISGYKDLFKDKTTKMYTNEANFEDIYALYLFDEELRSLFLSYLLKIERHFRSLLSYFFTEKYGESQVHYLNIDNYNNISSNILGVNKLIDTLSDLALNSNAYTYINFNRATYKNVPLWVLMNAITFGTLSKFYKYSEHDIRSKVSHEFNNLKEREIERILSVLSQYRNVCAHGERLYSYKTKTDIPDLAIHSKMNIPKNGKQYIYGKHDLFSVVISFKYLLENGDFLEFKGKLKKSIDKLLKDATSLSETQLYEKMGFPDDWKKITRYKRI